MCPNVRRLIIVMSEKRRLIVRSIILETILSKILKIHPEDNFCPINYCFDRQLEILNPCQVANYELYVSREKVSIDADFCVSIRPIHFPENEMDAGWRNKWGKKISWKGKKRGKGREEKEKKQSIGKIAPSKTSCNVRNSNRFYRGGHG